MVTGYPAHSFVVDKVEAASLFHKVEDLNNAEQSIMHMIEDKWGVLRYPTESSLVLDLSRECLTTQGGGNDDGGNEGPEKADGEECTGDFLRPEGAAARDSGPVLAAQSEREGGEDVKGQ